MTVKKVWLSPAQAAEHAGVHIETMRRWCRRGDVKAYRVNARALRISRDDLESFLMRERAAS